MSLDRIYTITIEMADALSAGDIQLFNDLMSQRQRFLTAHSYSEDETGSSNILGMITAVESKIELLLLDLQRENRKSLKRVLVLKDAATGYTLQTPKRTILRDGLSG